MKTLKNYSFLFLLGIVFCSCQKAFGPDNTVATQASGSLAKDASGNCAPVTVNGIYKKDSLLNVTHYIDVAVNVTATGNYLITTDTSNGIYFRDSAAFTSTGTQTVRLKGYGKPLTSGTTFFTVRYNGTSSCAMQLMVTAAGSAAASFTLAGAPGSCTAPVISGVYTAGTALTAVNKIQLNVTVTGIGDYTLSTTTVNGFTFNAAGTFNTTGPQTVTLSGNGTPVTAVATSMSVTGAPAGCSFSIPVTGAGGNSVYLTALYFIDTTLSAAVDTTYRIYVNYDAQNRTSVLITYATKPNGDSSYYEVANFFYNGNDTFAYRTVENDRDFSSATVSTSSTNRYYAYANGHRIMDSTIFSGGDYDVYRYTYTGTNIQISSSSRSSGIVTTNGRTTYRTFVNNNNTHQIDTFIAVSSGSVFHQREEVTTTYVPNPNPFYQVMKPILRPYYYDDIGITSEATPIQLMAQHNEFMQTWQNSNPPGTIRNYQINYTYTFRPDGYPIEGRQLLVGTSTTERLKMAFVYR